MVKNKTLVVLAAGIGSRYGGLKQLDSMTDKNEAILDFSVYDAIEAGFNKIVFIVRDSIKVQFQDIFDEKLKGKAEVHYVCQEIDNLPEGFDKGGRKKPWGTAHALLMVKDIVKENFIIINADDFYGKNAFIDISNNLDSLNEDSLEFSMVGYKLKNTLSENGYVSRGQCYVDDKGYLSSIIERLKITKEAGEIFYENKEEGKVVMSENTIVSMNFWGFTPKIFGEIEAYFIEFLKNIGSDIKIEFYIPSMVNDLMQDKGATVKVITSESSWLGVTYKEDKSVVSSKIGEMKQDSKYPSYLWA